jgi:aspartyl-tRNA(Asn)/glutamyl-tRNA(Gln) amidotransferase subunit A
MTSHPQDLSLREQARLIADGQLTPAELTTATLERIDARNGALHAVIETFPEQALASTSPGPLHGVPLTVKDMFSLPWRGYHNGTRHEIGPRVAAGPVKRLTEAGAVIVGVDNQHELGMGTTGVFSPHGAAANPWNTAHCAGGSSGGSAAAVAGRLVAGAIGSDSGGSTRLPAGWCGVVGLKLSYRALPYDGYTGANSTLSAPGVFARDSADARLVAEALLARELLAADASGLTIGVVDDPYWQDIDPEVDAACHAALDLLALPVRQAEIAFAALGGPAGALRAGAELGGAVPEQIVRELQPVTRGLLQFVAMQPARRLVKADRVRARLRQELNAAFASCDLLAWPTNPAPAPPIAAPVLALPSGPVPADGPNIRQATLANLAGVPAVSLPVGMHSSGLPIGLQLIAPWGQEARLLDAVAHFEAASEHRWATAQPAIG